jgi:hypothetical protein
MELVYLGNTLINDVMLGAQRMDDVFTPSLLSIDYLIVAGGGAGGGHIGTSSLIPGGGGGGAGGLRSGSLGLTQGSYQIIVGSGGIGVPAVTGGNGRASSFIGISTVGGGGGGGASNGNGANGGSGGGGGGDTGVRGLGTTNQGNNGGNPNGTNIAGGGGGAGSAGTGVNGPNFGSGSIWFDGLEYAIGGLGEGPGLGNIRTGSGFGNGGRGTYTTAAPAVSGSNGTPGVVILRYAGSGSRASGGVITFNDGYTYHTFTSASLVASNLTGSFII